MTDTVTLPGGRVARIVPAEVAGEVYLYCAEGLIAHLRQSRMLTTRQCDAAEYLARLYGKGGGRRPWAKGSGGDHEPSADARREFDDLLRAAPRRTHSALTTLSMGEWVTSYNPIHEWREGLDAVADRLKLAEREDGDE
jgi:hypothetical protein